MRHQATPRIVPITHLSDAERERLRTERERLLARILEEAGMKLSEPERTADTTMTT